MKKALVISTTLLVLVIGILMAKVIPHLVDPSFIVMSDATKNVDIRAEWRDKKLHIGILKPGSKYTFSVSDEAAMKFIVTYPNGDEIESKEIYFTSGTVVYSKVSDSSITVNYNDDI